MRQEVPSWSLPLKAERYRVTGVEIVLGAALLLQSSPPTVTLILRDGDRVVSVERAKRLLKSKDRRLQVAATLALGTQPSTVPAICSDRPARCETLRGRRLATQAQ